MLFRFHGLSLKRCIIEKLGHYKNVADFMMLLFLTVMSPEFTLK